MRLSSDLAIESQYFKIVYKIAEIRQTLSARKEAIGFFWFKD